MKRSLACGAGWGPHWVLRRLAADSPSRKAGSARAGKGSPHKGEFQTLVLWPLRVCYTKQKTILSLESSVFHLYKICYQQVLIL